MLCSEIKNKQIFKNSNFPLFKLALTFSVGKLPAIAERKKFPVESTVIKEKSN